MLVISIILILLSIGLIFVFQKIYNAKLKEDIAFTDGSLVTKIWEDIPLPIYEKLYFFNVTNEASFVDGSEPLNVTEVGPYTYKARWVKPNPQWNPNHTVSYREIRTYEFVPELSVGTEHDEIHTLNGPLIIAANFIPKILRAFFDAYCLYEGETVITKKSVRDLAYRGYYDPLIDYDWLLGLKLPYKNGIFSWLYGKNATDDGLFTVFTGTDDETKKNFINNWNGKEHLTFWHGDSCNMLNGTSIEIGPPIQGHQESYTFFQSFFCRSLTFKYVEDTEHYGISSKRFKPTADLFANSTENPNNYCFEVNKKRASGILDISPCQFEAPILVSFPHFHLADPSYLSIINGLEPNDDKHGSHIDVEPITGLSIDLTVSFQINLEIQKVTGLHFFNDITEGVYPVFWVELSLKIDEDLANLMKRNLKLPKIVAYTVISALLLAGCVGMIVSAHVLVTRKKEDDQNPLMKDEIIPVQTNYGGSIQGNDSTLETNIESSGTPETDFTYKGCEVPERKSNESATVDVE